MSALRFYFMQVLGARAERAPRSAGEGRECQANKAGLRFWGHGAAFVLLLVLRPGVVSIRALFQGGIKSKVPTAVGKLWDTGVSLQLP